MKTDKKKTQIRRLTLSLLRNSHAAMIKQVDKALNSGALDTDEWEADCSPMLLPKIIATAILEGEATQYDCRGTSYEKEIKKEVKNLKCFL